MKAYRIFMALLALTAILPAPAFTSREVVIDNNADGVKLAGTLTMPDSGKPRAAILMITGSGSQDRDETVFGHKPFRTIAEYMSDRGYAVLRTDDRGTGSSTGSSDGITTTSNIRDAGASLHWLVAEYPDVPVGLLGHSEGGQIAYRMASDSVCRFIITMGGAGLARRLTDNGPEPGDSCGVDRFVARRAVATHARDGRSIGCACVFGQGDDAVGAVRGPWRAGKTATGSGDARPADRRYVVAVVS